MANVFRKFIRGIILVPETSDPSETDEGQLSVNSTTNTFKIYLNGGLREILTTSASPSVPVTNKLLDDASVFFVDNADSTKQIRFNAGGTASTNTTLAAAQTANRVVTLPDSTDTLVGRATTDTLTNKTIAAASNTITGLTNANIDNAAAIAYAKLNLAASIVDADINAAAAIAYSKLALSNSIVNADVAVGAAIAYAKLALSNSIVDADINAAAAIAYSKLNLSASIVNADVAVGAAIAYSKLSLGNSIVNADINASAAIAYSKLNLSGSILNADIAAAANIDRTKINAGSVNHVVINDGAGVLSSEATLAKSRGGSGQDNSSITFPASGTLATLAGTQTFSNKTFSDAITGAQIATPSNPAASFNKLYFKADNELYKLDSTGTEVQLGTSGSSNLAFRQILGADAVTTADDVIELGGGPFTVTLFTAVGNTGKVLEFIYPASTTAVVTLDPFGAQTIGGLSTYDIVETGTERLRIMSDGANWLILSHDTISPWIAFTGTSTWNTNITSNSGFWRRVGDTIEVDQTIVLSGAPNAVGLSHTVPLGLTINTAKLSNSIANQITVGGGLATDTGVSAYQLTCVYTSTTTIDVHSINVAGTYASLGGAITDVGNPFTFGNTDTVQTKYSVPIVGWNP